MTHRNVETGKPLADGELPHVLLPDGGYERLPDHIDASDDSAIKRHYGVDDFVRTQDVGFCRGVLLDGPGRGEEVYAIRRLGATVEVGDTRYTVVDVESEVVGLRRV